MMPGGRFFYTDPIERQRKAEQGVFCQQSWTTYRVVRSEAERTGLAAESLSGLQPGECPAHRCGDAVLRGISISAAGRWVPGLHGSSWRRPPTAVPSSNHQEGFSKGRVRKPAPLCLEGVWGKVACTVTALRFPALSGRQSCRFLESVPLHPPQAALGPLSPMFLVGV